MRFCGDSTTLQLRGALVQLRQLGGHRGHVAGRRPAWARSELSSHPSTGGHIDPEQAARALAPFDPVSGCWSRANVLQLLVERVDYDGKGGELAITFRPAGLAALGPQQGAGGAGRAVAR